MADWFSVECFGSIDWSIDPGLRLQTSGKELLHVPQQCVCCGGIPDAEFEISRSTRVFPDDSVRTSLKLPYCTRCREHSKKHSHSHWLLWLLLPFGIGLVGSIGQGDWAALGMGVACSGIVIAVSRHMAGRAKAMMKGTCVTIGKPAKYAAGGIVRHTFYFRSYLYAEAFARANGAKVVPIT